MLQSVIFSLDGSLECNEHTLTSLATWWNFFAIKNILLQGFSFGDLEPQGVRKKFQGIQITTQGYANYDIGGTWMEKVQWMYVTPLPFSPVQFQYNCYYTKETNRLSHSDTKKLFDWEKIQMDLQWLMSLYTILFFTFNIPFRDSICGPLERQARVQTSMLCRSPPFFILTFLF